MGKKDIMVMSPEKEGEETEGARRATGVSSPGATPKYQSIHAAFDTEVTEKATRRRFTAEYKRSIIREAGVLREKGQVGALLRREGLYYSNLDIWRRQAERNPVQISAKGCPSGKPV